MIDYFPYGKVLREFIDGDQERYLTTQHERDLETGLDYRGARYYDGDIGRFLSLDPKAKKFPECSDYNYVLGNPIILIDSDGKSPDWIDNGDGSYTAEEGDGAWSLYEQHLNKKGYSWEEVKTLMEINEYSEYEHEDVTRTRINPGSIVKEFGYEVNQEKKIELEKVRSEIRKQSGTVKWFEEKVDSYDDQIKNAEHKEEQGRNIRSKPVPGDPGEGNAFGELFRDIFFTKESDKLKKKQDYWRKNKKIKEDELENLKSKERSIERSLD